MEAKEKVMCPKCGEVPAPIDPYYGVLWCKGCNSKKERWNKVFVEFVPDAIKEDRVKYKRDIVQPFRDGQPSKEFIDTYPERSKKMFTNEERRKAKPVWTDVAGWKGYR